MKTIEKIETLTENITQKGVFFLVLCLMTMTFACGKSSKETDSDITDSDNIDSDNTDTDITDMDTTDIDDTDLDAMDIDYIDLDIEDIDDADLDETDSDNTDFDETDIDDTDEDNIEPDINVDLGLVSTFAIASAAGIDNTGATQINGDIILDPDYTCNDVPSDNAGGFGLCAGFPPTTTGEV
ncbi:MAG TPA: hypothetical protein VLJ60_04690, partial [bacterium]|nr:hypothetical protein [bacterium]